MVLLVNVNIVKLHYSVVRLANANIIKMYYLVEPLVNDDIIKLYYPVVLQVNAKIIHLEQVDSLTISTLHALVEIKHLMLVLGMEDN